MFVRFSQPPRAAAFNLAPKLVIKLFKPLKQPLYLCMSVLSIGPFVHCDYIMHIEAVCINFSYHPNTSRRCRFPKLRGQTDRQLQVIFIKAPLINGTAGLPI